MWRWQTWWNRMNCPPWPRKSGREDGNPSPSSQTSATSRAHGRLLDQAEAALGALTTLVNNAGVSVLSRGDLLDVTAESYDRCLAINTRGTFFLTQAFAGGCWPMDRQDTAASSP